MRIRSLTTRQLAILGLLCKQERTKEECCEALRLGSYDITKVQRTIGQLKKMGLVKNSVHGSLRYSITDDALRLYGAFSGRHIDVELAAAEVWQWYA